MYSSSSAHSCSTPKPPPHSQQNLNNKSALHDSFEIQDSSPAYSFYPHKSTISHSSSLSTVALSSSSCGSLTTSLSSAYSISTINSDLELGHFINENNSHPFQVQGHVSGDPVLTTYQPHTDFERRPTSKGAMINLNTDILSRRFKVPFGSQLSTWECIIYAIFAFYVWVLVCTLAGDTRIVKTCAFSDSETETAVNNSSLLHSANTGLGSVLHHHTTSGLGGQAGAEYVAKEYVLLPPTPHPHPM
ncbi:hypothetical protein BDY19DRAFT_960447 [Irpex rosettiformis]|uniref:Uncharacterized protein n=1 Tax=Irpex rosettiformis TaxID=378272 RepID=A0ACB8TWX0_9APHY|nr:hypothetical protein BDY19DRAFT_960447 [Irpex rosettiformis]